jgi:molecular chaperone GrpE
MTSQQSAPDPWQDQPWGEPPDAMVTPDAPTVGADGSEGGPPQGGTVFADPVVLAAERDEYLAALQRMKADFDNYRKRIERLQDAQSARAAMDLVSKLLPVLDTLDLACAHARSGPDAGPDATALVQARAQLVDVLTKEGLERVDEAGVAFDPAVHDAVAHAPATGEPAAADVGPAPVHSDVAAGVDFDFNADEVVVEDGAPAPGGGGHESVVDEVLRSGYRWRGQVIRPAMVRVRG